MALLILNTMNKLLILLFQIIFAFTLNAQDITKYTTTNLNMRYSANAQSEVLMVIATGTPVRIAEDCDCKWIPVEYSGKIGYVSAKYLSKEKPSPSVQVQSGIKYYTNSKGERVQSPTKYNTVPPNATALCRDGTYSSSRSRREICSHHGGVKKVALRTLI